MAWSENIAYNVFDPRLVGVNLFEWFEENQSDALAWANDDADASLPPIKDFFQNARTPTQFPVCLLNRVAYETETGEDIAQVQIALQYEIMLVHGRQDWLAAAAPRYAMAFESMAKNIPKTRLQKDSKIDFDSGILLSIETTFDFLRGNGSEFMQSFITQVNWLCEFSNYAD